jgi:hypothetical protein
LPALDTARAGAGLIEDASPSPRQDHVVYAGILPGSAESPKNELYGCGFAFKRPAGEPMMKAMGRTKTRPVSRRSTGVPVPIHRLDQTHEIPAVSRESGRARAKGPSAAPQQVIPIEETVPVQSCIERTLLHEALRQQSAEKDEDHKSGKGR